jgi:hypothetical protein
MPGAYLPEDELLRSIRTVEATNRICDEAEARAKAAEQAAAIEQTVERMTERLAQIDAEKRSMLASAPLPIEGLELKDDGTVSYQGVPLAQASSAEQIKVGMAVGLFSNPNLKVVLIRDGSLLDDDSLRSVADIAASAGAQVWIERVGKSAVEGALTVVIEDGAVVEEVAS